MLGNCRSEISGMTARAACSGTATWTPKVGSDSARTDARQWDFRLTRTDAGWRIASARVQNR
jgi:hypothetical protein